LVGVDKLYTRSSGNALLAGISPGYSGKVRVLWDSCIVGRGINSLPFTITGMLFLRFYEHLKGYVVKQVNLSFTFCLELARPITIEAPIVGLEPTTIRLRALWS
jgi:hypothetical protein